jgi:WXG100 family type VII secretion target
MAGKVIYYGSTEFKTDLNQMGQAIKVVSSSLDSIKTDQASLQQFFNMIEGVWLGPAGSSLTQLQQPLMASIQDLVNLLDDILAKLQQSYTNYSNAEAANAKTLAGTRG